MEKKALEHTLIENLHEEFAGAGMTAKIFGPEENGGIDVELLRVYVSDYGVDGAPVLAEYFFMDIDQAAEDTLYFGCVINLSTELKEEHLPELFAACAKLNFYMTGGSFAVDPEETLLVFRMMSQMPQTFPVEQLTEQVILTAAHSLQFCEPYAAMMTDIAEGRGHLDSLLALLP